MAAPIPLLPTGEGGDLVLIHEVDGKDRLEYPPGKVLAETGGYFSHPRFSRKGDRIAFFEHPFKWDDRGSVEVIDLAGKKTRLSDGYWGEEGLAWSADGSEVMFSAGTAYNTFQIYGVTLDGKRRTALQSAGGLTLLDIAPDGRWIASRDDQWRDTPGLAPGADRERNLAWLDLTYAVALTPDGKTFLFTEESGSMGAGYATCIRQTDGSPVVRLGEGAALDISRDGRFVLSNLPADPAQLVLYPTGAGQPRKLDRGGLVAFETAVLFDDGRRVLACGHEPGRAVRCYVQEIETGKSRPVTPEGTNEGLPSPDGTQVLVRNGRKGPPALPGGRQRRREGRPRRQRQRHRHPLDPRRPVRPRAQLRQRARPRREARPRHRPPRALQDPGAGGPDGSPPDLSHHHQRRWEEPRVQLSADVVASVFGGRGAVRHPSRREKERGRRWTP